MDTVLSGRDVEALKSVLRYGWESERRDYLEQDDDGRVHHVFVDMIRLRDRLDMSSELTGSLND